MAWCLLYKLWSNHSNISRVTESKVEKIINPYEKRPRDVDISDELRNIKKELKLVFENLAKTKVN